MKFSLLGTTLFLSFSVFAQTSSTVHNLRVYPKGNRIYTRGANGHPGGNTISASVYQTEDEVLEIENPALVLNGNLVYLLPENETAEGVCQAWNAGNVERIYETHGWRTRPRARINASNSHYEITQDDTVYLSKVVCHRTHVDVSLK